MKAHGFLYILVGFALVLFGAVAPFLMAMGLINISLWLSLLAYSASVIGLFLGVFGALEIHQAELD
jgi:hypothetical protein